MTEEKPHNEGSRCAWRPLIPRRESHGAATQSYQSLTHAGTPVGDEEAPIGDSCCLTRRGRRTRDRRMRGRSARTKTERRKRKRIRRTLTKKETIRTRTKARRKRENRVNMKRDKEVGGGGRRK